MSQDNLAALEAKWILLIASEETAFERCVELDNSSAEKKPQKSEAVREWWSLANSILWMFTRTQAQHGQNLQPFPAMAFGRLANITEELSNGHIPSFVADVARKGRPLWRKERHHIAYAVFYLDAVKRGDIVDTSPNKTVRQAYNVTANAVRGWQKRRDEICVGVPHGHLSPEKLGTKMLECGDIYTRIGRGAPADN